MILIGCKPILTPMLKLPKWKRQLIFFYRNERLSLGSETVVELGDACYLGTFKIKNFHSAGLLLEIAIQQKTPRVAPATYLIGGVENVNSHVSLFENHNARVEGTLPTRVVDRRYLFVLQKAGQFAH